jgi:hypothetical protein
MLKIDPHSKTLLSLGRRTLEPAPLFERHAVADLLANSADIFFAEMGRAFFLVAANAPLGATGARRADLLLLDPDGRLYVVRLQRGDERIDLVEALEDAACVSTWSPDRVLALLDPERREMLELAFLKAPRARINKEQGILLLAESYDLDTLASAGWLRSRYGVRIDCYQLRLTTDSLTNIEYLSCVDLSKQVSRVYQRRESGEPGGAPWPAEAVPDISDRPRTARAAPPMAAKPAPAPKPEETHAASPAPAPEPVPEPQPAPEREPEPSQAAELVAPPAAQELEPEAEVEPATPLEAEVEAALSGEEEIYFTGELSPEDDPLADIIAGQQPRAEEEEGEPSRDRRGASRSRDYQARRLRLDYFGRLLGARLVDFSDNGLGVEALSPLPVGAEIGISGEIIGESGTVGIEGRAKVEHCRSTQEGVCRIGFSLAKAVITEIEDPETFDRR